MVRLIHGNGIRYVEDNKCDVIVTDAHISFSQWHLFVRQSNNCFILTGQDLLTRSGEHPGEKKIDVYLDVIRSAKKHCNAKTIVDPFMGSGVIGEAAISEGLDYIGIELEEKWFNLAKERLGVE